MTILLAALFGIGLSAALVPVCRALSFRLNCVARPSSDRWHKRPTPMLGGIAIVATVVVAASLFGKFHAAGREQAAHPAAAM